VPQVRDMCGVEGSPALALLDVDKERVYRLQSDKVVDADSLREFVQSYLKGELQSNPLGR